MFSAVHGSGLVFELCTDLFSVLAVHGSFLCFSCTRICLVFELCTDLFSV